MRGLLGICLLAGAVRYSAARRQSQIRQLLRDQPEVIISQLAGLFGVSEMTVRRDLDRLAADGQLERTHGGARPAERMVFEFDFFGRRQARRNDKRAIARAAVGLVEQGCRLIIDTGTTPLELAYLLRELEDVTVVTPSLAVASALQFAGGVETVLLGGLMRRGSPDLTGVVTEANLDMFAVDLAFLGADGIGLDGTLYSEDIQIAHVDQKIRQRADRTYVLADTSKIGKTALATNGMLSEVEALITDEKITSEQLTALEQSGGTIIIAEREDK
jgi:DeoR/GlpR family transcriptional regulator of sugar metabolism